jgi:Fic family protein
MDKINVLFNEWQSLQPLKEGDQRRLDQKFMLEFNYNSNHIEGNTLTYGQTEFLLMFGQVVDNANMKDLEEMKASNIGLKMVKEAALDKEQPLTEYFIRTLHQTLLREDYTVYRQLPDGTTTSYIVHAGQYKTRPNSVITATGERFEYASPEETPALMKDLLEWYNQAESEKIMSPIELATLFHYRYIRIHPFEDGNGRVSRLIVNYILYRHGYPMIVVKSADKTNYLVALNRCDMVVGRIPADGAHASIEQITPFVDYLSSCLERALKISIKAAKGESIEEEDDFEKQLKIIERNSRKEASQDDYMVTPQDKIDVFNKFHRQLTDKLINVLNPAIAFYNTLTIHYFMTKDRDYISGSGFFALDSKEELSLDMQGKNMDILKEAQSIMLHISLQGVKSIYKMKDLPIFLKASVFFEPSYYVFNGATYKYGSYPTLSQLDNFIKEIKNYVLTTIQKATEE